MPHAYTITLAAMLTTKSFIRWRNLLADCCIDFERFSEEEAQTSPMQSAGWSKKAILKLLQYDVQFKGYDKGCIFCCSCGRGLSMNELWWYETLELIRTGLDPDATAIYQEDELIGTYKKNQQLVWYDLCIHPKRLYQKRKQIANGWYICAICELYGYPWGF